VSESFAKLARDQGVDIQTSTTVTKVQSNGIYVQSKDEKETKFVPADLIIVNADLPYASKSLLDSTHTQVNPQNPRFDWDDRFLYSSGVVAFHWSIGEELTDLQTHNVFLAASKGRSQAEESWRILREASNKATNHGPIEPFNFYVHCPTKTDSTAAPKNCDSIMVLVPCPTLQRREDYAGLSRDDAIQKYKAQFNEEMVSNLREALLNRFAAIESLSDLMILDEVVDTPGTFAEQYHVGAGTPFALSHGFGQLSLTRPGPKYQLESPNILYCGASSRPGNGVPLVLIGSKLVTKKVLSFVQQLN
jgi:phytoene dehydrogenase-like protein